MEQEYLFTCSVRNNDHEATLYAVPTSFLIISATTSHCIVKDNAVLWQIIDTNLRNVHSLRAVFSGYKRSQQNNINCTGNNIYCVIQHRVLSEMVKYNVVREKPIVSIPSWSAPKRD